MLRRFFWSTKLLCPWTRYHLSGPISILQGLNQRIWWFSIHLIWWFSIFLLKSLPPLKSLNFIPKPFALRNEDLPPSHPLRLRCSAAPLLQTTFADLHDRAGRMKAKGVIRDSISWWGALSWVGAMMATWWCHETGQIRSGNLEVTFF